MEICGYQFEDGHLCLQVPGHWEEGLKHIHPGNDLDLAYFMGWRDGHAGKHARKWTRRSKTATDTYPYGGPNALVQPEVNP